MANLGDSSFDQRIDESKNSEASANSDKYRKFACVKEGKSSKIPRRFLSKVSEDSNEDKQHLWATSVPWC